MIEFFGKLEFRAHEPPPRHAFLGHDVKKPGRGETGGRRALAARQRGSYLSDLLDDFCYSHASGEVKFLAVTKLLGNTRW